MRIASVIVALLLVAGSAGGQSHGIAGRPAPGWGVNEWINLPQGKTTLDVADLDGKVVYVLAFQSWCPGCHSRGLPTLKRLIDEYGDADDVAFVAVQTVFEGYSSNTPQRAWATARQYELDIPVGHDGSDGRRSILMGRYRTGGTPWVIIIDKTGVVKFNDFHIPLKRARVMIDGLRNAPEEHRLRIETLPAGRGGQDLVGTPFGKPSFDRVIKTRTRGPAKPKAVLYRWWTDTCPYCRSSLPAVEQLRRTYGPQGLEVVGVYHPKPPQRVDDGTVLATARQMGYLGLLAVDEDWSALQKLYLSTGDRQATSASFLVDAGGTIRFVHPGPVFFPSDDPASRRQNNDYQMLEQAIRTLLEIDTQPTKKPTKKPTTKKEP